MTTPAAPEVAAIGIHLQVKLDPDKSLVLSTGIAQDTDLKSLNSMLDKLSDAAQRMEKRYLIPAVEKSIEVDKRHLEQARKDLQKLEIASTAKREVFSKDKKRGDYREDEQTAERRRAIEQSIEEFNARIAKFSADLVDLKKAAFSNGADGGTDLRTGA